MEATRWARAAGVAVPPILAREQVAAVCFRCSPDGVELILVRSGAGKWTFPKGRVEPGESLAAAAAREAKEEAGVSGVLLPEPLTTYRHPRILAHGLRADLAVTAFLLEVVSKRAPVEAHRAPTWFSPAAAADALRVGRSPGYATELARVVERAVYALKGDAA